MVKRAMCHIRLTGLFLAILACLSILYCPGAQAQAAGSIRQNLEGFLTANPARTPAISGSIDSRHSAFIPRRRPIKIIGKN